MSLPGGACTQHLDHVTCPSRLKCPMSSEECARLMSNTMLVFMLDCQASQA